MSWSPVLAVTCFLLLSACASLPAEPSKQLEVSQSVKAEFVQQAFTAAQGIVPFSYNKTIGHGEWMTCQGSGTKATALIMHSDRAGYDKAKFCSGWIAQAFLASGYDVVTVNRPGYGGSDGAPDFSGGASLVEVAVVVPEAVAAAHLPHPLTTIWGYDTGAAAGALAAKHLKGVTTVVLGGGIYDYDDALRTTGDEYLRADLAAIKRTGGEKAFEDRSVAYDLNGLPPNVIIYHAANDKAVPISQAKSFNDSLASNGRFKVTYQIVVAQGHDLPWVYHRHLLEALLKQANPT